MFAVCEDKGDSFICNPLCEFYRLASGKVIKYVDKVDEESFALDKKTKN